MKKILPFLFFLLPFHVLAQSWQWARECSGLSEGMYCATDGACNIYAAGMHWGTVDFDHDTITGAGVYMVKYDSVGNVKWVVSTSTIPSTSAALGVTTDMFGNEYLLGMYDTAMSFGGHTLTPPGPHDNYYYYYFIAKIDSTGYVKWVKNVGNAACNFAQLSKSLYTDPLGNLYLTCPFSNNPTIGPYFVSNTASDSSTDILVVKFDSSGAVIWAKGFGGKGWETPYGITANANQTIYINGYFDSDSLRFGSAYLSDTGYLTSSGYLAKLDISGNPVWAQSLYRGLFYGIAADTSENVFVAGGYWNSPLTIGSTTLPSPPTAYGYGMVAKYSPAGTPLWGKAFQGNYVLPWNLAVDPCENIWVLSVMGGGHLITNDTIDGHILVPPAVNGDPNFIAGWTNSGTFIQASALPSGSTDDPNGIAIDKCGNIYIVADLENCTTVVIASDTLVKHIENMFIAKYNPNLGCGNCGNILGLSTQTQQSSSVTPYPNPAHNQITIEASGIVSSIKITNAVGQVFTASSITAGNKTNIDVSTLQPGLYYLQYHNGFGGITVKFVKQ
jgi:hypothetical protein